MPGRPSTEEEAMPLYTFFVEKKGETWVEQVDAASETEAVARWHQESQSNPGPVDLDDPATPLEGRRNGWCFSGVDPNDVFYLVHFTGPLAE
jgi:hypothetical protein